MEILEQKILDRKKVAGILDMDWSDIDRALLGTDEIERKNIQFQTYSGKDKKYPVNNEDILKRHKKYCY